MCSSLMIRPDSGAKYPGLGAGQTAWAALAAAWSGVMLLGVFFAGAQVWLHFSPPFLPPPPSAWPRTIFYLAKYTHIHLFGISILGLLAGSAFIAMAPVSSRQKSLLPPLMQGLVLADLAGLWLKLLVSEALAPIVHISGALMIAVFVYMVVRVLIAGVRTLAGAGKIKNQ